MRMKQGSLFYRQAGGDAFVAASDRRSPNERTQIVSHTRHRNVAVRASWRRRNRAGGGAGRVPQTDQGGDPDSLPRRGRATA
ncbi:hypothetical protein [Lysobacter gummosus]|uniref:hypothetical protein n=1 Tax=Lysobacter gummosus TaxID=262324 RepID=UPI0036344392